MTSHATPIRTFDDRLQVFDDPTMLPADPATLEAVRDMVAGTDLAAPPTVLPNFHHKAGRELPSSVAVATRGQVRPDLTSASVNCGMALIALDSETPGERALDVFMRSVRERFPSVHGHAELTTAEVIEAAAEGAEFAVERWNAPPEDLERIEEGGRIDLQRYGGLERLRTELPGLAVLLARYRFGAVGPAHHFIEVQRVEEVLDAERARRLGVSEGQVTLQYHGAGGMLTGELGGLFFRRPDRSRRARMTNAVLKPWFHLRTSRSYAQLRERLSLYFTDGCPPVPLRSDEGQRLMLANAAAMNYGFASRAATYASLRRLAAAAFGGSPGRLVVDSPHHSIYEETLGDSTAVVHRHHACRAYPAKRMLPGLTFADTGQAVLLPGTDRTGSYLAVAGDDAAASLHSTSHGSGAVVADLVERGISGPDPLGRRTRRYRYDDAAPAEVPHHDDRGVHAALDVLVRNGLVRPVARMRPLAVLH